MTHEISMLIIFTTIFVKPTCLTKMCLPGFWCLWQHTSKYLRSCSYAMVQQSAPLYYVNCNYYLGSNFLVSIRYRRLCAILQIFYCTKFTNCLLWYYFTFITLLFYFSHAGWIPRQLSRPQSSRKWYNSSYMCDCKCVRDLALVYLSFWLILNELS